MKWYNLHFENPSMKNCTEIHREVLFAQKTTEKIEIEKSLRNSVMPLCNSVKCHYDNQ